MGELAQRALGLLRIHQESHRLPQLPLSAFAKGHYILPIESALLDGRIVWFVSGEAEVEALRRDRVGRGVIYTAKELITLLATPEEKCHLVIDAKIVFKGILLQEGGSNDGQR